MVIVMNSDVDREGAIGLLPTLSSVPVEELHRHQDLAFWLVGAIHGGA